MKNTDIIVSAPNIEKAVARANEIMRSETYAYEVVGAEKISAGKYSVGISTIADESPSLRYGGYTVATIEDGDAVVDFHGYTPIAAIEAVNDWLRRHGFNASVGNRGWGIYVKTENTYQIFNTCRFRLSGRGLACDVGYI